MDASNKKGLRYHYPEIEPFDKGFLKVSDLHEIFYEQCGKKDGNAVLYLHGGPGGGIGSNDRRYFDPSVYRIILHDQRGSGNSKPAAELRENTTWDLVSDIEKLRVHLGIEKWVVFGGSWGSTLSLVYAQTHPTWVKALILRGIFTMRRVASSVRLSDPYLLDAVMQELTWYYQDGASRLFPDTWEKFLEPIPEVERHDLMSAYHRRLVGDDKDVQLTCAKVWSMWEMATSRLYVDQELIKEAESDEHYFVNGGFFKSDTQVLDNVDKIRHIPCTIIQGRYDIVCPADTAWQLHKRWPEAEFHIISDAGHSAKEKGITSALITAADKYKTL